MSNVMEKEMRLILINLIIFAVSAVLFAEPCGDKKKLFEQRLDAWKEIETKMKSSDISKAQYDELLPKYNKIWEESENLRKDYLKCKDESENLHKAAYNDGIQLKKDKKLKEALAKFAEAIKIKSDFDEAYYQAADVSAELGNYGEMEKYLEGMKNTEDRGKIYYKVGNDITQSNPDLAIDYYIKMAKYYKPDNAYYLIGSVYITKKNDPEKAVNYYRRALGIDAKDHKTYNALGGSLVELSNLSKGKEEKDKLIEEAISVFLKGIQLGPKGYRKYYELCVRLAQLYNVQGRAVSALEYADKAIEYSKDSKYSLGHLERGIALIKMKKYDDAKNSFKIAQEDFLTKQAVEGWLAEIDRLTK
jgi:tetratricopeptide (TPR) repeat protein